MKSRIEVILYEESMMDQIVDINVEQYHKDPKEIRKTFQKITGTHDIGEKGIAIVAVEGSSVVGVQTYRYWPYLYKKKKYYSLQSGGTLVKSSHRGQGLFMKMLSRGNELLEKKGVDFVMGFPVAMSYGGFIKDGWVNLCSPRWYIKLIRPVQLAQQIRKKNTFKHNKNDINLCFENKCDCTSFFKRYSSESSIVLSTSNEFLKYRYDEENTKKYVFWSYQESEAKVYIICKISWSHGYQELIVGDILCNLDNFYFLFRAFSKFISDVKIKTEVSAVSMIIGGNNFMKFFHLISSFQFIPLPNKIKFILKNIGLPDDEYCKILNKMNWSILAADLDTW